MIFFVNQMISVCLCFTKMNSVFSVLLFMVNLDLLQFAAVINICNTKQIVLIFLSF